MAYTELFVVPAKNPNQPGVSGGKGGNRLSVAMRTPQTGQARCVSFFLSFFLFFFFPSCLSVVSLFFSSSLGARRNSGVVLETSPLCLTFPPPSFLVHQAHFKEGV